MLKSFLPTGSIWENDELTKVLSSFETEIERFEARSKALLIETNPKTSVEMLTKKELEASLPDLCTGKLNTIQERQNALVTKWSLTGGATKQYLINAALNQGYGITIQDGTTDHVFTVHAPAVTSFSFRVGSSTAGEALISMGTESLECLITRIKPAHTKALFVYDL